MMALLSQQTAVITGASSGIGAAIALCFAEEGAKLRLVGRNAANLEAVAQGARKNSPHVLTYQADLSADEDLEKLAAALKRDCDTLDVLIHSAGNHRYRRVRDCVSCGFRSAIPDQCSGPLSVDASFASDAPRTSRLDRVYQFQRGPYGTAEYLAILRDKTCPEGRGRQHSGRNQLR